MSLVYSLEVGINNYSVAILTFLITSIYKKSENLHHATSFPVATFFVNILSHSDNISNIVQSITWNNLE